MKLTLIFLSGTLLIISLQNVNSDESPGFFLKVTKNVPRLGKRSDSSSLKRFFHKTSKNVPRIGRRNDEMFNLELNDRDLHSLSAHDKHTNLMKRKLLERNSEPFGFYEYNVVQPVDSNQLLELLVKDMLPNENLKFVAWKDFDKALQNDRDLFAKMISLGQDSLVQMKQDLSFKKFIPLFDKNGVANQDDFLFYEDDSQNEIVSDDERKKMKYEM